MTKRKEKMYSVRQAAELLEVAPSTVRMWLKDGLLQGAVRKESELGVPYWSIPESVLRRFEKPKTGRPRKPLEELIGKPRRKD
jgi:hypothetical protein